MNTGREYTVYITALITQGFVLISGILAPLAAVAEQIGKIALALGIIITTSRAAWKWHREIKRARKRYEGR